MLLATDGLQPSSKGARVRISDGKFTVTDGPFTETKELVAGFAIVQAKSKQDAIELAKRFLKVVGEGESEIRLMHDVPAFDAAAEERQQAGAVAVGSGCSRIDHDAPRSACRRGACCTLIWR